MSEPSFALVIGSSSGLGLEITNYLLEEGYLVFGASRGGSPISHENYSDIQCDVRDEDDVASMFESISEETDGLNLLVNCAGIFEVSALIETESEVFADHLQTHVLGAFHVLKYLHPLLIENETHIIHLNSLAAKRGYAGLCAFSASKFALTGLLQSVREEWRSLGVRFSTLVPSAVDTPLWDEIEDAYREQMIDVDEFLHVFDMVVKASTHLEFPELVVAHKTGGKAF
jgi:3-oxoacyl-[acyl-carrier protein] reductase